MILHHSAARGAGAAPAGPAGAAELERAGHPPGGRTSPGGER